ncbi:phospholipid transfer protein [Capsaspora owczarzaki ATCC 30864]|nr:phospholipid transfer protein [Capsaspora owczarzaki ATCC 30864]|eukprot:XP_004344261.1 phospholipid transfer protein [Capsaspora owczarzaki ATCC 30864]
MKAAFVAIAFLGLVALAAARPVANTNGDFSNWALDPSFELLGDVWSNCSAASDHLHIINVQITPDPPVKGKSVTIAAAGNLDKNITSGSINLSIKFGIIPVLSKSVDLCTVDPTHPCPLPAGPIVISQTEDIPSSVPSGHYTGTVKVTDQDNQEVACIDLDLHL